jgi:hypothetical protein
MSLVIDALNKARQQTAVKKAGVDPQHLASVTAQGGGADFDAFTLLMRSGKLLGIAGAIAVIGLVAWQLKPTPQNAAAVPPSNPALAAVPVVEPATEAVTEIAAQPEPAVEIVANQPKNTAKPIGPPAAESAAAPAKAEPDDAPLLAIQPYLEAVMAASEPIKDESKSEPQPAPVAEPAAAVAAPAPAIVVPPPAPEPVKPNLVAGREYVQSLDLADVPALRLGAIAWSDAMKVALINGATVEPGQQVAGVTVKEIEPKRVLLEHEGRTFYLRLP